MAVHFVVSIWVCITGDPYPEHLRCVRVWMCAERCFPVAVPIQITESLDQNVEAWRVHSRPVLVAEERSQVKHSTKRREVRDACGMVTTGHAPTGRAELKAGNTVDTEGDVFLLKRFHSVYFEILTCNSVTCVHDETKLNAALSIHHHLRRHYGPK